MCKICRRVHGHCAGVGKQQQQQQQHYRCLNPMLARTDRLLLIFRNTPIHRTKKKKKLKPAQTARSPPSVCAHACVSMCVCLCVCVCAYVFARISEDLLLECSFANFNNHHRDSCLVDQPIQLHQPFAVIWGMLGEGKKRRNGDLLTTCV